MDLGIGNKWALVCGASKGLGLGCAQALMREGVNVLIVARGAEALEQAAAALRAEAGGSHVLAVPADITTVAGRAATLTSSSPTLAARRRATFATGIVTPGSRRWMPTCSRLSN